MQCSLHAAAAHHLFAGCCSDHRGQGFKQHFFLVFVLTAMVKASSSTCFWFLV
jgi:hypothetical protein